MNVKVGNTLIWNPVTEDALEHTQSFNKLFANGKPHKITNIYNHNDINPQGYHDIEFEDIQEILCIKISWLEKTHCMYFLHYLYLIQIFTMI